MSKCTKTQDLPVGAGRHDQVKPRSYLGMLNMCMDTHGDAIHAKMAKVMQRHVNIRPIDPELPDSPTGSPRQHADLQNELKSHAYGDVDGSNTAGNVSVTPGLHARGAVSHRGEQKGPGTKRTRCMHAPRRREL